MIAQRCKAALFFLHANQHPRIGDPRAAAEAAHDGFVAGQLQIPIGQRVHHPYHGIEPVGTHGGDQQELGQRVEALDMDKFVLQNIFQRCFVLPVRSLRHQYDRAQHAEGERRGNAVGLPDGHSAPQRMRA